MEIKKSPKADLQNKRGLLLEIGLVVALILVIAAFAYTPKEYRIEKPDLNYAPVEEEITEITRQDQKPPEPPKKVEVKVIADLLQVVTNDTKITTEVDFAEFDENTEVVQQVEVVEETIEDDQPFLIAETMPLFPMQEGGNPGYGDLNTFRAWVQKNIKYPAEAFKNGEQGRVVLSFVVEKGRLGKQHPDSSNPRQGILGRDAARRRSFAQMETGRTARRKGACEIYAAR